jgi:hypothetical protein
MARIVDLRSRRKPVPKGAGITIEKGVPLPAPRGNLMYPFDTMAIGDSFTVTPDKRPGLSVAAAQYKRNHKGWDYTTRMQASGLVRVWRTK